MLNPIASVPSDAFAGRNAEHRVHRLGVHPPPLSALELTVQVESAAASASVRSTARFRAPRPAALEGSSISAATSNAPSATHLLPRERPPRNIINWTLLPWIANGRPAVRLVGTPTNVLTVALRSEHSAAFARVRACDGYFPSGT